MDNSYRPLPETTRLIRWSMYRRAAALLTLMLLLTMIPISHTVSSVAAAPAAAANLPFCRRLVPQPDGSIPAHPIAASSGAWLSCFGPQRSPAARPVAPAPQLVQGNAFQRTNVNAADPQEDIAPDGVRGYGQIDGSVAATGRYVVEAWIDSTAFYAPCPSPQYKEELTGFAFSTNGGASFTDQGGLPNDCTTGFLWGGDPSVEAWQSGGIAYFYISSFYSQFNSTTFTSINDVALSACKATGTSIACGMPTIVASGIPNTGYLDKPFLSIDPVRGRLYLSYTRFGQYGTTAANGQIELAVCDIGTAIGGTGAAGGTAANPTCFAGASTTPYLVVAAPDANCENEGAYPAVDLQTGDVYVAWEFNWHSALFAYGTNCQTTVPIQQHLARTAMRCLTLTAVAGCSTPTTTTSVNIVSMEAASIQPIFYGNVNDFPRIAVSEPKGTVSIVWNDARFHPLGDILLASFNLGSLSAVQSAPVRLNSLSNGGLHLLPALRNADPNGNLNVSFYQRATSNTTRTSVTAALAVDPRTTSVPTSNTQITNVATDWLAATTNINPYFGDYTDNYLTATTSGATSTNHQLHIAWTDGRIGDPQPFHAHGTD